MKMSTKYNLDINPEPIKPNISILCFNLTNFTQTVQFIICTAFVFLFYLLYGYIQELIFHIDGFQPYGWFLTLVQFGFYSVFGIVEKKIRNIGSRKYVAFYMHTLNP